MASGILRRGNDLYAGHEADSSYLLLLTREAGVAVVRLGRDVMAEPDGAGGLVLSSPHTPARLGVTAQAEFVLGDGSDLRFPQLPVIRRLLDDPSSPQPLQAETSDPQP